MFHSSTAPFRKGVNCPSSQQILKFLDEAMGEGQMSAIRVHLSLCDFCSAEAAFYSRFPDAREDEPSAPEMPRHLYDLACALMSSRGRGSVDLDALVREASESDCGLS